MQNDTEANIKSKGKLNCYLAVYYTSIKVFKYKTHKIVFWRNW